MQLHTAATKRGIGEDLPNLSSDRLTGFLVLTSQRSGSAWLISILNRLENVAAYGELFLRRRRLPDAESWDSDFAYPRFIESEITGLPFRPFSVFSYLNALYRHSDLVGFKLMYSQLRQYPEILAYMVRRQVHVVHLIRQNHLDVLISGAIAARIGRAHLVVGEPELGDVQVELNPETLMNQLHRLQRNITIIRKLLRLCSLPNVEVAYEDLLRGKNYFDSIWEFLSINPGRHMPQSNLAKIRKGEHVDVISNHDEIREVLSNSTFAHLLH